MQSSNWMNGLIFYKKIESICLEDDHLGGDNMTQESDRKKSFIPKKIGDSTTVYLTPEYFNVIEGTEKPLDTDLMNLFNEHLEARKLKNLIWTGIELVLQHQRSISKGSSSTEVMRISDNVEVLTREMTELVKGIDKLTTNVGALVENSKNT